MSSPESSFEPSGKPLLPVPVETGLPETTEPSSHLPFPIVGVGASAGGLEAFTRLLENLPADPGLAFILVLHLDPHHESLASNILARSTSMAVQEAVEGMPVRVNNVYVIPPNSTVALADGSLQVRTRSPGRRPHMPVDHLFRSLATVQRNKAIGVILSGGGTDGTLGLQEISAEEGITFAQDEPSARHDAMPRSAILAGCVDFVLPPEGIAQELVRVARHVYELAPQRRAAPDEIGELSRVFHLLRTMVGIDFSQYKQSTIQRRIRRRMALRNIETLTAYVDCLNNHPEEVQALAQDFLIRVTSFFRDPAAFQELQQVIFPRLLHDRPPDLPIRIWVAGCSTGEEVYSIAISLLETLGDRATSTPIKILATDISETSLEKARAGIYIENIEVDVSPERLRRYFVRVNGHYQISKSIRDLCVYARHNLVRDPPFSKLDLISCRNVLIYLNLSLQKRVMPIFHYALKPGGFLMLGSSETIGNFGDLFETVSEKQKIYIRRPAAAPVVNFDFEPSALPIESQRHFGQLGPGQSAPSVPLDLQKEADRLVLQKYAPAGVVVDEDLNILQFRGRTGPYLEPSPGLASLNLSRMAREGLLVELRKIMNQVRAETQTIRKEGLLFKDGEQFRTVNVDVTPMRPGPVGARCYLVLFEEAPPPPPPPPPPPEGAVPDEGRRVAEVRCQQLHQELDATREYLQSVIEEHEATNEELKSAHEEILSSNEELQSTNEELQTAKEEMQSANEELSTVNEELRHRNLELGKLNDDLINILSGVNLPIVMVGRDRRIHRFTPLAEKLFNLIPTDAGRQISDIRSNLNIADLDHELEEVIQTLTGKELEVQDNTGRWYSVRLRPYVTLDNKIDGASIVAVDIHDLKSALEKLQSGRDQVGAILESIQIPLVLLDKDLRVTRANSAFHQLNSTAPRDLVGKKFGEIGQGQWNNAELLALLNRAVAGEATDGFMLKAEFPRQGKRILNVHAQRIAEGDGLDHTAVAVVIGEAAKSQA